MTGLKEMEEGEGAPVRRTGEPGQAGAGPGLGPFGRALLVDEMANP